jgi:uncharacterized membrane protein
LIELLSNSAHVHLLLNHVPTVGFGLGLALFLVGQLRKNDDLKRTSLVIFFVVAVVSIATYLSGSGAEAVLRGEDPAPAYPPGVLPAAIRVHEDAAFQAFVLMETTGFFAWLALWQWRRVAQLPRWNLPIVLVLSIVTFALMARAAELGGEIHHSEIWVAQPPTPPLPPEGAADGAAQTPASSGMVRRIGQFVMGESWVWPTCETLHFIGLSMLFTVVLLVDLRMLGMAKAVPYSAVYQLLPLGMLGFGLNLITGLLFFIGVPSQYVHNATFYWKIVFVLLGGLNVLYFMLDDAAWSVGAGDDAPRTAKIAAASAIVIWAAVLFCGHMLPFIGNAF